MSWSPKAIFARGSTEKQEIAQRQERKRLDTLNSLKSSKGALSYENNIIFNVNRNFVHLLIQICDNNQDKGLIPPILRSMFLFKFAMV